MLDSLSERLEVELKEFGKIKSGIVTDMKIKRPSEFKKILKVYSGNKSNAIYNFSLIRVSPFLFDYKNEPKQVIFKTTRLQKSSAKKFSSIYSRA